MAAFRGVETKSSSLDAHRTTLERVQWENRSSGEEEKERKGDKGCGRGEERREKSETDERMKRENGIEQGRRERESYDYYAPCCFT